MHGTEQRGGAPKGPLLNLERPRDATKLKGGGFSSEQKSRIPHYLRTGYFLDQGSPSLIAIISVKGLAKAIGQNVTL